MCSNTIIVNVYLLRGDNMLLLQWLKGKRIVFLSHPCNYFTNNCSNVCCIYSKNKCFYKGISIDGLDISGLSFLEARAHVGRAGKPKV